MKKVIRLTESDLHRIVRQCINEIGNTANVQNMLGRLSARKAYRDKDYDGSNEIDKYARRQNEREIDKDTNGDPYKMLGAMAKGRERGTAYDEGYDEETDKWRKPYKKH